MTTTNRRLKLLSLSRRLVAATVVLFALSFAALCSAAEATFGPGRHYSVQLPDGWVSKLDEKDNTLGANGPGRVTLNAMVATTETSPEALRDKITTRSTEKKAGYKLLEKGTATSKSGHKAHVHRYQLDSNDGPQMWIDYYFQLAQKEVVLLVFAFPMDSAKPPKKEIEAILDSVKVVTTANKDESWTDSSAEPAASPRTNTDPPAPAGPKASGTAVTFATNCSLELPAGWTGKAVGTHLEGKGPDGAILDAFSVQGAMTVDQAVAQLVEMFEKTFPGYKQMEVADVVTRAGAKGKAVYFRHNGKAGALSDLGLAVVIKVSDNQLVTLRFAAPNTPKLDDAMMDAVHATYRTLKVTAPAQTAPKTAATRVTFANNCSVELPAGWTGKASGKRIEATGPEGMRLDGSSEPSPVTVDLALAMTYGIWEKTPGYELVDMDEISTKAGAKGKLAYFRYNGKSGPVAEVAVIIEAKKQMTTLRFLAPSASKKLDENFSRAVEDIYTSLKLE